MYRIDNATAVAALPTPAAVGPKPNSYFTKGDPGAGIPATIVDDDWANAVQEELIAVVVAAGLTPSKTVRTQVRDAINLLIAANIAPDASQTVKGVIEIATDAEVQTGTDAVRAVTPAGLSARSATETRTGVIELATAAEAQALTDAVRALTPARLASALQGANQSLAASGYQKLPGGLILQWGTVNIPSSAGVAVTFPIAFPNAVSSITSTSYRADVNTGIDGNLFFGSISASGFTVRGYDSGANAFSTMGNAYWIAIGY